MRVASLVQFIATLFTVAALTQASATTETSPTPAASTAPAAPAQRPMPCANGPYREFDFWAGEWDVRDLDGSYDGQAEVIYLLRTPEFEIHPRLSDEELRAEYMVSSRWWTIDELLGSEAMFSPRKLARLVATLLEQGPPAGTVDVGV